MRLSCSGLVKTLTGFICPRNPRPQRHFAPCPGVLSKTDGSGEIICDLESGRFFHSAQAVNCFLQEEDSKIWLYATKDQFKPIRWEESHSWREYRVRWRIILQGEGEHESQVPPDTALCKTRTIQCNSHLTP